MLSSLEGLFVDEMAGFLRDDNAKGLSQFHIFDDLAFINGPDKGSLVNAGSEAGHGSADRLSGLTLEVIQVGDSIVELG